MFRLSYNTNGLLNLPLDKAVEEVSKAGYEGIEISLHPSHLHPYEVTRKRLDELKRLFASVPVKPVSLATGGMNLLGDVAFEPSLISPDKKGRDERIRFITAALEITNYLSIPVLNFTSGIRQKGIPEEEAGQMLTEGIRACLKSTGQTIMVIEPEILIDPMPPMFIHTTGRAIAYIKEISSAQFRLNIDISHSQCIESDLLQSVSEALPYTRHIHIADIKERIHHHEIPGEGDIDFRGLLGMLENSGYKEYLSVELYWHCDEWERALYQSRKYLLEQMRASEESG